MAAKLAGTHHPYKFVLEIHPQQTILTHEVQEDRLIDTLLVIVLSRVNQMFPLHFIRVSVWSL